MRRVTRNVVLATLLVVVLLLALGALPQYLRSGDPYYVTATAVDAPANVTPVNGSTVPRRRYPYTYGALDAASNATDGVGRSAPYWRGPFGIKGAFTHSPFDETNAYRDQHPGAVRGDRVFLRHRNATYRLDIVQP